jgi:hypothetical protein
MHLCCTRSLEMALERILHPNEIHARNPNVFCIPTKYMHATLTFPSFLLTAAASRLLAAHDHAHVMNLNTLQSNVKPTP